MIAASLFVSALLSALAGVRPAPPVRVVLVVMDDVGVEDLIAVRDAGWLPNMTALAAQGFIFTNATSAPICSPSRRMMLFGDQYARQSGSPCASPNGEEPPSSSPSLAAVLGGGAFLGKWHVGANPTGGNWRSTLHERGWSPARWLPQSVAACGGSSYSAWTYVQEAASGLSIDYQPAVMLADFFAVWGVSDFLVYSTQLAHLPYHRPPASALPSGYPATPTTRAKYEAMIAAIDYQVGQMLSAIDLASTVVIFVGDNGTPEDVAPIPSKAKKTTFQRGVHVPLFMVGAGVPQGQSCALVSVVDLYATICELRGVTPPAGLDSRSLLPIANGQVTSVHDRIAFGIQSYSPPFTHDLAARTLRYKYRRTRADDSQPWTEELYDLLLDYDETANIAASKPNLVSSLRAYVDQELP